MKDSFKDKTVQIWLNLLLALIALIVVIGGITRLTHSGLSMVEWRPLMGTLPPLNQVEWQRVFSLYQNYPQYKLLNQSMTLFEFKWIFLWEYLHRLLGRLIGLAALIPFIVFTFKGKFNREALKKASAIVLLLGAQGVLGWFMVKSGLVSNPDVSHFRLAAHLSLAFLLFSYILWLRLSQSTEGPAHQPSLKHWARVLTGLIGIQIIYGAFVAGLNAGFVFNTFPKMGDRWMAESVWLLPTFIQNLTQNMMMVQFIHRWLAVIVVVIAVIFAKKVIESKAPKPTRKAVARVGLVLIIQFILGILTLVLKVPIVLAVAHQLGALALLSCAIVVNHKLEANSISA
jgi:heme a synthase